MSYSRILMRYKYSFEKIRNLSNRNGVSKSISFIGRIMKVHEKVVRRRLWESLFMVKRIGQKHDSVIR